MNHSVQKAKMQNLLNSVTGFINSNYPDAIIQRSGDITYVGYPGEKPRVALRINQKSFHIQVMVTTDFDKLLSSKNSKQHILVSNSDMPAIRAAITTILSLNMFEKIEMKVEKQDLPVLPEGYAYITDRKFNVLGMYKLDEDEDVEETDKIDDDYIEHLDASLMYEEGNLIPTIYRFLKKD